MRVNNRAVPSSPGTGRRPSQSGWCQGSPCPRQCCSAMSLGGGGVTAWCHCLSKGRTGTAVTGSAHGPAVPMEIPAAQQLHRLLLMSGSQLLFPWVFWAGSRGKARGGGWFRGQSEVGRGCMSVLVDVSVCFYVNTPHRSLSLPPGFKARPRWRRVGSGPPGACEA